MSKAEKLLFANKGDYIASEEALISQYRQGKVTYFEYAEVMNELHTMFLDALDAQEKMLELNQAMATCEENGNPMTYDDWEICFLEEVLG